MGKLGDKEALIRMYGQYLAGLGPGESRPLPDRKMRRIAYQLLGITGAQKCLTLRSTWRKKRLDHGIDPTTFEVLDPVVFDDAWTRIENQDKRVTAENEP